MGHKLLSNQFGRKAGAGTFDGFSTLFADASFAAAGGHVETPTTVTPSNVIAELEKWLMQYLHHYTTKRTCLFMFLKISQEPTFVHWVDSEASKWRKIGYRSTGYNVEMEEQGFL